MTGKDKKTSIAIEHITQSILILRGQRVLLDSDLTELYGVTTKRFNERVRRNLERFPADFELQLVTSFKVANATLKPGRGQHRNYTPFRIHRTRHHHVGNDSQQSTRRRDERNPAHKTPPSPHFRGYQSVRQILVSSV